MWRIWIADCCCFLLFSYILLFLNTRFTKQRWVCELTLFSPWMPAGCWGHHELRELRQTCREHDFCMHRMLKAKPVQADSFGDFFGDQFSDSPYKSDHNVLYCFGALGIWSSWESVGVGWKAAILLGFSQELLKSSVLRRSRRKGLIWIIFEKAEGLFKRWHIRQADFYNRSV